MSLIKLRNVGIEKIYDAIQVFIYHLSMTEV